MGELKPGDTVRIQPTGYDKDWKPAVVQREVALRSYEVVDEREQVLWRNRRHLRRTSEPPPPRDIQVTEDTVTEQPQTPDQAQVIPEITPPTCNSPAEPRRSSRIRKSPEYLQEYTK